MALKSIKNIFLKLMQNFSGKTTNWLDYTSWSKCFGKSFTYFLFSQLFRKITNKCKKRNPPELQITVEQSKIEKKSILLTAFDCRRSCFENLCFNDNLCEIIKKRKINKCFFIPPNGCIELNLRNMFCYGCI